MAVQYEIEYAHVLSQFLPISVDTILHLLTLDHDGLRCSEEYQELIRAVQSNLLVASVAEAHRVLDDNLSELVKRISYGFETHFHEFPLTSFVLTTCILYTHEDPGKFFRLPRIRTIIPRDIIVDIVPEILDIFGLMVTNREQWQLAFATTAILLTVVPDITFF